MTTNHALQGPARQPYRLLPPLLPREAAVAPAAPIAELGSLDASGLECVAHSSLQPCHHNCSRLFAR